METEIRTRVLVVPFENATGDPSLDPLGLVAAEAILQELAATGMASVGLSDPLGRHGEDVRVLPGGRDRNGDVAQGVAEADLLVTGTITIRGGELAFEAGILDAGSNTIVLAVEPVLGSTDNPTDASESLRNRLAGALAMALDPRLSGLAGVASYPPSYRAYQLLADGLGNRSREKAMVGDRERRGEMWEAASAAYLDAAALEPGFTLPLIFALDIPTSPFDSVLAVLRPLRDQLPRWERAMLDYYLAWDEADQFGQYRAMQRVVEISPTPDWTFRLAVKAVQINRPQEALQLLTQLGSEADWLEGQPDYWLWVADAELLLKDHESALEAVRQARSIRPDNPRLLALEVEALARSGREESAIQRSIEAVETTGHPGTHFLRYQLPQLLTVAGLEEEGQRVADVSLSSFSRMENLRIEYVSATYVAAGRFQEAREVLEDLSGLQPGRKLHAFTLLSFMAAREGRAEEAMGFAEMAASVYQVNGFDRAANGVMAQAQAAAHLGDRAGAVRFLLEAYRLGLPHGAYVFTRWDLRPLEGYGPFEDLMRPKG